MPATGDVTRTPKKRVRFSASNGRQTDIGDYFCHSQTVATEHADDSSPLLKLRCMPPFIRRATSVNVIECAKVAGMPLCRVMPKLSDLRSLVPDRWITDNVSCCASLLYIHLSHWYPLKHSLTSDRVDALPFIKFCSLCNWMFVNIALLFSFTWSVNGHPCRALVHYSSLLENTAKKLG